MTVLSGASVQTRKVSDVSAIDPVSQRTHALLRKAAFGGTALVAVFCGVILTGWILHAPALTGLAPLHASTSVATALCFLLGSAAVFLDARRPSFASWLSYGLVAVVLAVASYDFATYLQGGSLAGYLLGPALGRMAPATATGFALLSLSVFAGAAGRGYVRSGIVAVGLGLALIDIVCHIYGAQVLYGLATFAAMSLFTAICFLLLFMSLLFGRPHQGWIKYLVAPDSGGAVARVLLPAILIAPFALSWAMVAADSGEAFAAPFGFAVVAVTITFVLGAILCVTSAWLSRSNDALRRLNLSLLESERSARGIIDTALDAFVQIDEGGRITEWNPQAEEIFGWSRNEAIGAHVAALIAPHAVREGNRPGFAGLLNTADEVPLGKRLELEAVRKSGEKFQAELAATSLAREGGLVFNGFIRDVTEKLAVEAHLRQAQKMEAIGNLTGGIAHDFNNILAVIVGNLDELLLLTVDESEANELAQIALSAALHGADLTQRLLAFSRQQPLQPRRVALDELLEGVLKLLTRTLGKAVRVEFEVPAEIWPVTVDASQFEAAILNLATNARDAMPNGGTIRIAAANSHVDGVWATQVGEIEPGDYAVIEVTDDGEGMSTDVVRQIFEPFFTTKERSKGTGLGLAMVFGFVKQSNGHVSVYSEPGIGTTFRIYLPRAAGDEGSTDLHVPQPLVVGDGETVLVVEDNTDLRALVCRQVASLGYMVREAESATAAWAILESESIDILFSDIVMPGRLDGAELARRVMARWPSIRIVLTSGFADGRARTSLGELAASIRLLRKPYRKEQLADALHAALEESSPIATHQHDRQ